MKTFSAFILASMTLASLTPLAFAADAKMKFDFGPGKVEAGYTQVTKASVYSKETGYGFLDAAAIEDVDRGAPDALRGDFCASDKPFLFAVDLPEGDYNVVVTLGDQKGESETTV